MGKYINKKNVVNLFSLSLIQGSNIVFSLLAFPYILVVCGINKFSLIALTESVALIILIFILYGLDIVASERSSILINKNKKNQLFKLYYNVIWVRLFLLLISLLFSFPLLLLYNPDIWLIYISWNLFIFGQIIHSYWLFQIKSKNLYPSLITFSSRFIFLCLIYLFVKNEYDYQLSVFFIGLSYFLSGFMCMIYGRFLLNKEKFFFDRALCLELLYEGKPVMFGSIFVVLFRGSNVLLLGVFSTELYVAIYSLSEKIIKGMQSIIRPINQLVYPLFLKNSNPKEDINIYIKKLVFYSIPQLIFSFIIFIALCLLLNVLEEQLIAKYSVDIGQVLWIMVPAVFFGIGNYMLGTVGLNYRGRKIELTKIIAITGVFSFIFSMILIQEFNYFGAAFSYSMGEFILFFQIVNAYRKY